MSNVKHSTESADASMYHVRVLQLEKELDEVREASFKAIRDLKTTQEAEENSLKKKFENDLENVTLQYEQKLKEEILKIQKDEERRRQTEIQSRLSVAEKEWAEAEELKFKKFQVELVHAKNVELAERDAYWRSEISRLTGLADANGNEGRRQTAGKKKQKEGDKKEPGRGTLVVCALLLAMSASAFLYELAPLDKPSVKSIIEKVVSKQDAAVQNAIYTHVPWLKSNADKLNSVSEAKGEPEPEAVVRTTANLRDEPNLAAGINRVLGRGTRVHVLEVRDDWSRVAIGDKQKEFGWVHNSLLTASE